MRLCLISSVEWLVRRSSTGEFWLDTHTDIYVYTRLLPIHLLAKLVVFSYYLIKNTMLLVSLLLARHLQGAHHVFSGKLLVKSQRAEWSEDELNVEVVKKHICHKHILPLDTDDDGTRGSVFDFRLLPALSGLHTKSSVFHKMQHVINVVMQPGEEEEQRRL